MGAPSCQSSHSRGDDSSVPFFHYSLNIVLLLPPAPAALVLAGRAFAILSALSAAAFLRIAVAGPPGALGETGRAVVEPVDGELIGEEGRGEDCRNTSISPVKPLVDHKISSRVLMRACGACIYVLCFCWWYSGASGGVVCSPFWQTRAEARSLFRLRSGLSRRIWRLETTIMFGREAVSDEVQDSSFPLVK